MVDVLDRRNDEPRDLRQRDVAARCQPQHQARQRHRQPAVARTGVDERRLDDRVRGIPDRFILGVGVSHASFVQRALPGVDYDKPLTRMREYLDEMDAAEFICPKPASPRRVLGAVGPRMVRLAAERTDGAFTYLMPPEHTVRARGDLDSVSSPGAKNLAVELMVVLDTNADSARETARRNLTRYLQQPNYLNGLRSFGFTDDDFGSASTPASDRVIDAIVAWGDEDAIVRRIREHETAGADHVAIQVHVDAAHHAARRMAPPRRRTRRLNRAVSCARD